MRSLILAASAALLIALPALADSAPPPTAATPAATAAAQPAAAPPVEPPATAAPDPALVRYLNIRGYGAGRFSADGRWLAFNSSVTGTTQKWLMEVNGSFPRQITYAPDGIEFCDFSPHDPELMLLGVASGGDENTQLYFIRPDGTGQTPFATTPGVMFNAGSWSRDGRYITYSANLRDRQYFNVYLADMQQGGAQQDRHRLIFEKDANLYAGPFNPSGTLFVVGESHTNFDQDMWLVRTADGARALLTAHEPPVRFGDVQWTDDDTIYFTTDQGREFLGIARMDLGQVRLSGPASSSGVVTGADSGGAEAAAIAWDYVHTPDYDVESIAISDDGQIIAWVENVDGLNTARLGRLPDFAPLTGPDGQPLPLPAIPPGVQGVGSYDRQTRYLNFGCSGSAGPSNVWRYDLRTGETRKLTESSFGGLDPSGFVDPQVLSFPSFDGLRISALWYEPRGERPAGGWPVVVEAHGGPEGQSQPWFSAQVQLYASRGVAVLQPNPRGSTGYGKRFQTLDDVGKRLDSVKDYAAARDYLVASGLADPSRIAITGGSYGGYMVLACLTENPDKWAAGVCAVGIANFVTFLENTSPYRRVRREAEYGSLEHDRAMLESISPIHKVGRITAPLMLVHGTNDPRVPVGEAQQMHDALVAAGKRCELLVFDDEGHGIAKLENRAVAWQRELEFLRPVLGYE